MKSSNTKLLRHWPALREPPIFQTILWCTQPTERYRQAIASSVRKDGSSESDTKLGEVQNRPDRTGILRISGKTKEHIGPTEERVRAVVEASQPENMHELRSFLGLVNYSARFIPGFATISEPLRKLTRKDVPFVFGREQCTAFCVLKRKLTNAMKLAHFDKEAPTKVIADASPCDWGRSWFKNNHMVL